jgi:phosphatidate cytidylyltransferase
MAGRNKRGSNRGDPGQRGRSKKSDLKARTVTGVALVIVVGTLAYLGSTALFGLLLVLVVVAQGEFYLAVRKAGHRPATALGLVGGASLLFAAFRRGEGSVPVVLFLTLALAFVWHAWGRSKDKALADMAVTILGVAYVPLLASFAAAALSRHDGRAVVLATIGAAAVYDICAYAGGRKWGRRPLAPRISPGKTREGALFASAGVIVASAVLAPLMGPWNIAEAAVLGALVCIVAPLGDLFESVMKRDLGLKDMGAILPGHGGVLDRIDAILFCVPASYLSLRLFKL